MFTAWTVALAEHAYNDIVGSPPMIYSPKCVVHIRAILNGGMVSIVLP
jgi:hypothetical protein